MSMEPTDPSTEEQSMNKIRTRNLKEMQMPLIITGAGIIVLVIFVVLMISGKPAADDRIRQLEGRIIDLEALGPQIADLKESLARLQLQRPAAGETGPLDERVAELESTVPPKLAAIESTLTQIEKQIESVVSRRADRAESSKPPAAPKPADAGETSTKTVTVKKTKPQYHTVETGETVYQISRRYDVSVEELVRMNSLGDEMLIRPGQRLLIGGEGSD